MQERCTPPPWGLAVARLQVRQRTVPLRLSRSQPLHRIDADCWLTALCYSLPLF